MLQKIAAPILPEATTFNFFGAHFVFVAFVVLFCVCLFVLGGVVFNLQISKWHAYFFFNFRYYLFASDHRRLRYSSFHLYPFPHWT